MAFKPGSARLYVHDVEASCAWLARTLGFETQQREGSPVPHVATVARDGMQLTLRWLRNPALGRDEREQQDLNAVNIELDSLAELQTLFDHASTHGARIRRPIESRPWGVWTFVMRDLDNNLFLVTAPRD